MGLSYRDRHHKCNTGVGTVSITFFLRLIRIRIRISHEAGRQWLRLSLNLGETEKGGEGTRPTGSEETPSKRKQFSSWGGRYERPSWPARPGHLQCYMHHRRPSHSLQAVMRQSPEGRRDSEPSSTWQLRRGTSHLT
jgi:hypothetical protein